MDNRELTWRSGWFAAATMQHGREQNRREQHWIAENRREQHKGEGGRLFMVIICPIGWGMAQRGESKHKERFVQRQRNARPNKTELAYLVHWLFPFGFLFLWYSRSSTVHTAPWLQFWSELFRCKRMDHLYIFYPLEALVEGEVVPNCVLKLLPRLEFVSRTMQNQSQFASFWPFLLRFQTQLSGRVWFSPQVKRRSAVCNLNKVVRMQLVYLCLS